MLKVRLFALQRKQTAQNMDKPIAQTAFSVMLSSLVFASSIAYADEQDPLNFIVGVSRMHDNNLFKSANNERSENITSAYAGIRLDKQYAQQRFKFDFTLTANRYQNFDVLDYNSKNYKAAWLWTLTPFLTGTISLDRNQSLSGFQDFNNSGNVRNINVNETQHFEADFSPHNVWHLLGGVTRTTLRSSTSSTDGFLGVNNFTSNSLDAGVKYSFRSGSSLTAMGHVRKGENDNGSASRDFDNAYNEREVEAKLDWALSGKSRLNARAGYMTREHDASSAQDYSGLEGNVNFVWSPTGKVQLVLFANSSLSAFQTSYSSYTRTTTFGVRPNYALSGKVTMNAHADISKRSFMRDSSQLNVDREDWTKSMGVGVNWAPFPSINIGANLDRSTRDSDFDGSLVGQGDLDFSDTTASINANLFF